MSWRRRHRPSASCRPLRSRLGEFPVRGAVRLPRCRLPLFNRSMRRRIRAAFTTPYPLHRSLRMRGSGRALNGVPDGLACAFWYPFVLPPTRWSLPAHGAGRRNLRGDSPDGLRRPRTLQRRSRLVAGRLEPRPRRMVPSKAAGDSVMILHVRQVQVRSGSADDGRHWVATSTGAPVTDLSPQPDGPIWHTLGVDEVLAAEDVDPRRASTQPRSPRGLSASVRTDSRRARRSPGCMRSSVSSPTPCRSSCWWPELGASIR